MAEIKCFFLEPTGRTRINAHRSERSEDLCPDSKSDWHGNSVVIEDCPSEETDERRRACRDKGTLLPACTCGRPFSADTSTDGGSSPLYRRADTGEEMTFSDAPVGAMLWATWEHEWKGMGFGPDGRSLHVKTPGGIWNVDSRASNCTMPEDNEHRCWVRHGEPPNVSVDKQGHTCQAGAGSIQCGSYHGFLTGGVLIG